MKHLYLMVALLSLATQASAYEFCVDGIYYNKTSSSDVYTVEVAPKFANSKSNSSTYTGKITIPATVTYEEIEYQVVGIYDYAFNFCTSLESVILPESVTRIRPHAFDHCTSLKSVEMSNVQYIENYAFYACTQLQKVCLLNIKTIGEYAFASCENLETVSIDQNCSISSISKYTFNGCSNLKNISLPTSINYFGDYCFARCASLESISIPEGVTTIGASAFMSCTSLKTISLPESLTYLGEGAFAGNNLEAFEVADGNVKFKSVDGVLYDYEIGNILSYPTNKDGDFTLPNTVSTISPYAFYNCTKITSFKIPECVTTIGKEAFAGCTGLTKLTNESEIPQQLYTSDYVFGTLDLTKIKLIVPSGSAQLYQSADVWSGFSNLVALNAGDFNNDGNITVGDMALLIAYLNGTTVEGFDAKRADINNDGSVNMTDLEALKSMALELAQ